MGRRPRRWPKVSEKRRIAELTFEPGSSVALVARAQGVNANQVFKWRRPRKRGETCDPVAASTSLLSVVVAAACEVVSAPGQADAKEQSAPGGSIPSVLLNGILSECSFAVSLAHLFCCSR